MSEPLFIGVDPGRTVGFATVRGDGELVNSGEADWEDFVRTAHDLICRRLPGDEELVFICERYTVTNQTLKKSRQLEAIYCTGWLLGAQVLYSNVTVELQTPAQAKRFATDEKLLRQWKRPIVGDHARDAARHALLNLVLRGRIQAEDLYEG